MNGPDLCPACGRNMDAGAPNTADCASALAQDAAEATGRAADCICAHGLLKRAYRALYPHDRACPAHARESDRSTNERRRSANATPSHED